jgi:hypothetical protein
MKLIYTANDIYEAEILAAKLRENGLFTFINSDTQGGMRPGISFGQGVKLFVSEDCFDEAVEILQCKQ